MIELITFGDRIIAVDIVGNFDASGDAELTDYPIESGALRQDHKIVGPPIVTCEIQQTEHPLDDPQYAFTETALGYATRAALPYTSKLSIEAVRTQVTSLFLLAGAAIRKPFAKAGGEIQGIQIGPLAFASQTIKALQTTTPRDRGLELDALLQELLESPDTCVVTYRGKSHPDLSLISLSRNYTSAGLTSFSCTFKKLRTAQIARIELTDPAVLALKAKQAQGKKKDSEAAATGTTRPKSIAKSLFGKK